MQLPTGKWELQIPEDQALNDSHRWTIGFVTTGFVLGRQVCEHVLIVSHALFLRVCLVHEIPYNSFAIIKVLTLGFAARRQWQGLFAKQACFLGFERNNGQFYL